MQYNCRARRMRHHLSAGTPLSVWFCLARHPLPLGSSGSCQCRAGTGSMRAEQTHVPQVKRRARWVLSLALRIRRTRDRLCVLSSRRVSMYHTPRCTHLDFSSFRWFHPPIAQTADRSLTHSLPPACWRATFAAALAEPFFGFLFSSFAAASRKSLFD